MNEYKIEVVSGGTRIHYTIHADGITYSGSGVYEFWNLNPYGAPVTHAHFPIRNTIIQKVVPGE